MISCDAKIRRWGNSLGITLPKELIRDNDLKESETIQVIIAKKLPKAKEFFGLAKGKFKKSSQQMKDELRAELYHD